MIILSRIEIYQWADFSDHWIFINMRSLQLFFILFSNFLLFFIVIKNCRAVLGSLICSLTIERGRIVRVPKYFKQAFVGNYFWVVGNLGYFCMAGSAGTYFT